MAIHRRKEVENFLLIAPAIDRAAARRVTDHARRGGTATPYSDIAADILGTFTTDRKTHALSRYLADRKRFQRGRGSTLSEVSLNEAGVDEFEQLWSEPEGR